MNKLLELYQSRFGGAVRKQGDGYNGPCPLCGGEPGKSDRFMVWDYKTENLSKVCTENHIAGVYNCRQCGATGDTVSYLINIEGMSFKEALEELGIKPNTTKYKKSRPAPKFQEKAEYMPKEREMPMKVWQEFAMHLQEKAMADIHQAKEAKKYLNARGICDEAIAEYKLGYLCGENRKQGIFRMRKSLGLEAKEKNGVFSNKIFIPRGITIPTYWENELISLRIRRPKMDILPTPNGYTPPKYMELEGSAKMPFILLPEPYTTMSCFVVVEAELDAILIHYATKKSVGVVAVRSNQNKPCPITHELIKDCPRILFAMDYEESNAGIAGIEFWEENYPQLKRWVTPEGKDPGEAYQLGIDIAYWINLGLPSPSRFLQEKQQEIFMHEKIENTEFEPVEVASTDFSKASIAQEQAVNKENQENLANGHLDSFATGSSNLGERGNIFLYFYQHWGLSSFIYMFDGRELKGKDTCFYLDKNIEAQNSLLLAERISFFYRNDDVMDLFHANKHIWFRYSDLEKKLKKEGMI